jgi:hypothetical protein
MRTKLSPRALVHTCCAAFALTTAFAQNVEVRHDSKDAKSVPITQELEPRVQFLLETGYESEYNFRGTNLMPGAVGAYFYQVQATIPKVGPGSLTLGVYGIHQIGDAQANTWSISEGGGGGGNKGSQAGIVGGGLTNFTRFPTTYQSMFREWDLFVSYRLSLGPVDVTFGNIAFLIQREAKTFETDVLDDPNFVWVVPPTFTRFRTVGPEPTVEDEQFDRIYVRLSTTKLCRYITPSITYYQTIYNNGSQPSDPGTFFFNTDVNGNKPSVTPGPNNERNEELGGYLEGRVNGNFPVGNWLDINPYAIVSYSFKDRSEPAMGFAGKPLTGFNHAQAGLELDFHITPNVAFVPFAAYSYHISEPPIGTNRDEFWAGVKVSVNL